MKKLRTNNHFVDANKMVQEEKMTYKAELERIGDELHWTCHANLVTDKGCEFFNVT